jgi:hypothetical protein
MAHEFKKVLERKPTAQKVEKNWFMFASGMMNSLASDYISMRILYCLEPLTTAPTTLLKMIEIAEKSLKLFISVHTKTEKALSDSKTKYGHNIEKLRNECASIEPVFADPDICEFTSDLNDKTGILYQYLRYNAQETTDGFSANLYYLIPIIDKLYFSAIMLLPENDRRTLNFTSTLKNLLTDSQFDQSQNKDLLKQVVFHDNQYAPIYLEYCRQIDDEHRKLIEQFEATQKNSV